MDINNPSAGGSQHILTPKTYDNFISLQDCKSFLYIVRTGSYSDQILIKASPFVSICKYKEAACTHPDP